MNGQDKVKAQFQALRLRDGDICALCNKAMDFTLPRDDPMAPTREHIVPRAAGGNNALTNQQLAHKRCNQNKGAHWRGVDYGRGRSIADIARVTVRKRGPWGGIIEMLADDIVELLVDRDELP